MKEIARSPTSSKYAYKTVSNTRLIALLFSRVLLFALFQAVIALALRSWHDSEGYWMLVATMGNLVSILFLYLLYKKEGMKYLMMFKFDTSHRKKDLPLFLGLSLLLVPMALAGGGKFRTLSPTKHTKTNAEIIKKFLDVKIAMNEYDQNQWEIEIWNG